MDVVLIAHGLALLIAAIAAVTDFRTGEIPNWLTLPPLVAAPLAYGMMDGLWAAVASIAAASGKRLTMAAIWLRWPLPTDT